MFFRINWKIGLLRIMSGSFKTFPKTILVTDLALCDDDRVDRFGNKFKTLAQKLSFRDCVLDKAVDSVVEYDQVEVEIERGSSEGEDEARFQKRVKSLKRKKLLKKKCGCCVQ